MSDYKIAGHCTTCDARCFDVMQVFEKHELYPGEPRRLGAPTADAVRVAFMLMDGTKTDLTFCGECAAALNEDQYLEIWRKNMRSWKRELKGETPDWFRPQFHNGLLCEMGRRQWTEIVNG